MVMSLTYREQLDLLLENYFVSLKKQLVSQAVVFSGVVLPFSTLLPSLKTTAWRQYVRVVGASDLKSGGPGFKPRSEHYLKLFLGRPEFNSCAVLVK